MNKVSGRNKIKLVVVLVCLITLLGIGFSYAYWRFTGVQTNRNVAVSKCLELSMDNQKDEVNLTNIYPISDEEGRSLKPYTFTLTNTCTMSAEYSVNLEMLEGTTMNSKYLATLVNNGDINLLSSYDTTKVIISGSIESRVLDTGILTPGASKEYSISLWMDKSVTLADDVQNKNFKAKVIVDASVSTGIIDKIVSQLDTTGKCPTVNDDGSVNVTSAESENSLLCSAPDNYGTSYYYRGNVSNNYVKFAGFYWRIVRINGDGSIRMIYDGTEAHQNGEASEDRIIGTSVFNNSWKKNNTIENNNSQVLYDNAGIGYMYGNREAVTEGTIQYSTSFYDNSNTYYVSKEYVYNSLTDRFILKEPIAVSGDLMKNAYVGYYTFNSTNANESNNYVFKITDVTDDSSGKTVGYSYVRYGTTSKEKAQNNINDSDIKDYIDDWYKKNIKNAQIEEFIADNLFCNDRCLSGNIPVDYTNKGYGTEKTSYRWYYFVDNSYNNAPILSCSKKNDAFSVGIDSKGNGLLEYGIGLITTDEIILAGGWNQSNQNYYLYAGQNYWTMTPYSFSGFRARNFYVYFNGYAYYDTYVNNEIGVRPVLSISPKSLKSGDGTMNNPYTVE